MTTFYTRTVLFALTLAVASASAQTPMQPGQFVPLTTGEKFNYRVVGNLALRGIVGSAIGAGIAQANGTPSEWGGGFEGYGKRYASTLGGAMVRGSLNFALETAFREDPRYFPLGGPSKKARVWNALKQTFLTRTDSGGSTFAFARVASALATGQIERSWMPASTNSVSDGFVSSGLSLGVDAGVNMLYEFVRRSRPKLLYKH